LPLRANLSVLENIALIPTYQKQVSAADSRGQAQTLLDRLGYAALAPRRDSDLQPHERFVAKLARALVMRRSRLVIERPAAMLTDVDYPGFLRALLDRSASSSDWEVLDFSWNRPLYGDLA
jgi:ABC-type arginine transport system ATPase subunit